MGLILLRDKYGIQSFPRLARIGGAGYRTLGSIHHKRSHFLERLWRAWAKPVRESGLPLEFWIGRGLNPYLYGLLVNFLREKMKPKDSAG